MDRQMGMDEWMSKTQMVLLLLVALVAVSVGVGGGDGVAGHGRQSAAPQQQHRPPQGLETTR